jgi:ribosomal protein S12 methylthiotransferase accessory factor
MMDAAIAAVFDQVHDQRLGIVSRIGEIGREPGAPEFVHVSAETCDTVPLGGVAGRFRTATAATTREAAFAGAVAAALTRYAAALYAREAFPLATAAGARFAHAEPRSFALFSEGQYRRPGFPYVPFSPEAPVRWASTVDLSGRETVHVPASLVWHPFRHIRSAGDLPVAPPGLGGLALGDSEAAANLAGLYDVVARDAAALFWISMTPPPHLQHDTLPPSLRGLIRRFEASGGRVTLLDATTDNRIPTVIAVLAADDPDVPALVFAAASNLDPATAAARAVMDLAEARRLALHARRTRPPPSPANDWEDVIEAADHLNFAAARDNAERIAFILASEDRRHLLDRESGTTGSVSGDLDRAVERVALTGVRVLSANLTGSDIAGLGLAVCRVIVPGYQPLNAGHLLRPLGTDRLFEAPQKLGHRGMTRGSAGNPSPHPFGME